MSNNHGVITSCPVCALLQEQLHASEQSHAAAVKRVGELEAACRDALRFARSAVRAGLEGFTAIEESRIVENHVDVKALVAALAPADAGRVVE